MVKRRGQTSRRARAREAEALQKRLARLRAEPRQRQRECGAAVEEPHGWRGDWAEESAETGEDSCDVEIMTSP